jgi:A/G-specific adenine glycosylase
MLQQTRVEQMLPYYGRFLAQFPTVELLAQADLNTVLKAWEGLGYYSRARNLHRAAQILRQAWPQDYQSWLAIPGVGPYTARALAAILNHEAVGAVDGNIRRIYSRLFAQGDWRPQELQALADHWVDPTEPGAFVQALMDLGSMVCTPRQPRCSLCPLQPFCQGFADGRVAELPLKIVKPPVRPRYFLVLAQLQRGGLLIRQRPAKGLLGGLWELPNQEVEGQILAGRNYDGLLPEQEVGTVTQRYTHFEAVLKLWIGNLAPEVAQTCRTVSWEEVGTYPFSRGFQKILMVLAKTI